MGWLQRQYAEAAEDIRRGGIYHVYNRFARGADLFSEPEEAIQFLEILRKARARDDLAVLAWHLKIHGRRHADD